MADLTPETLAAWREGAEWATNSRRVLATSTVEASRRILALLDALGREQARAEHWRANYDALRKRARRYADDCPNDHGPDGIIECWSPGGPCLEPNRPGCDTCGPCHQCGRRGRAAALLAEHPEGHAFGDPQDECGACLDHPGTYTEHLAAVLDDAGLLA